MPRAAIMAMHFRQPRWMAAMVLSVFCYPEEPISMPKAVNMAMHFRQPRGGAVKLLCVFC